MFTIAVVGATPIKCIDRYRKSKERAGEEIPAARKNISLKDKSKRGLLSNGRASVVITRYVVATTKLPV